MFTAQNLFVASLKNPQKQKKKLKFEAFMAMNIKTVVFWSVQPCSPTEGNGVVSVQLIGTVHSSRLCGITSQRERSYASQQNAINVTLFM
jgi:hypothetical protein